MQQPHPAESCPVRSAASGAFAVLRATALEIACDPLSLLITLSALLISTLAPALHYHQFGEPGRMAREAGLSALLIGSLAYTISAAKSTMRREMESGTLQMALVHSAGRGTFLVAKACGIALAYVVFFATVTANMIACVRGAELGAAAANGDIAKMWGPSLALQVATLVVPLVLAAALNRFASWRFVRSAAFLMLISALISVFYRFDGALALRHFGAALLLAPPAIFFAAAALAASVRLSQGAATAAIFALIAVSLPALGAHYLPGALEKGGSIAPSYILIAFAAALALAAAALALAKFLFDARDIS